MDTVTDCGVMVVYEFFGRSQTLSYTSPDTYQTTYKEGIRYRLKWPVRWESGRSSHGWCKSKQSTSQLIGANCRGQLWRLDANNAQR